MKIKQYLWIKTGEVVLVVVVLLLILAFKTHAQEITPTSNLPGICPAFSDKPSNQVSPKKTDTPKLFLFHEIKTFPSI
ncbi:MAG TPA: hypothetical protein PLK12_11635 [Prolixibacteraceae bacterium]|nr:hypothetical protein [Prolixibacteraceae bacterium]